MKEYNIKDYLNPELSKEIIEELVKENAELKAKVEKLDKMTGIFSARLCEKYRQTLQEITKYAEGLINCNQQGNTSSIGHFLLDIITYNQKRGEE